MKVYEIIEILMKAPAGLDIFFEDSDGFRCNIDSCFFVADEECAVMKSNDYAFPADEDSEE